MHKQESVKEHEQALTGINVYVNLLAFASVYLFQSSPFRGLQAEKKPNFPPLALRSKPPSNSLRPYAFIA